MVWTSNLYCKRNTKVGTHAHYSKLWAPKIEMSSRYFYGFRLLTFKTMSGKPQYLVLKGRVIKIDKISSATITTEGCTLHYFFQGKGFSNTDFLDTKECKKFLELLVKLDILRSPDLVKTGDNIKMEKYVTEIVHIPEPEVVITCTELWNQWKDSNPLRFVYTERQRGGIVITIINKQEKEQFAVLCLDEDDNEAYEEVARTAWDQSKLKDL